MLEIRLEIAQTIFGLAAAGLGLKGAALWNKASRVQRKTGPIETWSLEHPAPAEDQARIEHEQGIQAERLHSALEVADKSAQLNRSAAKWTAWSSVAWAVTVLVQIFN